MKLMKPKETHQMPNYLQLRLPPDVEAKLTHWRNLQPAKVSRPNAAIYLMTEGMKLDTRLDDITAEPVKDERQTEMPIGEE